jgi:two-component system KDP operon response regulator KdpE
MQANKQTILVVDDDPNILKALQLRLKSSGYNVLTAPDGSSALTLAGVMRPDLVITDIWMPVGVGFSLAYRLKQSMPEVPFIFLTASKQAKLKAMAEQLGAAAFLEKPYEPEILLRAIALALQSPVPAFHESSVSSENGREDP